MWIKMYLQFFVALALILDYATRGVAVRRAHPKREVACSNPSVNKFQETQRSFRGGVSALFNPKLVVANTADARKPLVVQCNYAPKSAASSAHSENKQAEAARLTEYVGFTQVRKRQTDETIHSLKLKVDGEEVFRYIPSGVTQYAKYDNAYTQVKSYACDDVSCSVTVHVRAGRRSWRCELSAEWPTFDLMSDEAAVDVVAEPIYGPTIVGEPREAVSTGSVVFLNCSTDLAAPPAHITWLVDDVQVEDSSMSKVGEGLPDELGLRKSFRGVRVEVPPGDRAVIVQCVTKQPGVDGQRSAKIVLERAQPRISKYTSAAGASSKILASGVMTLCTALSSLVFNSR